MHVKAYQWQFVLDRNAEVIETPKAFTNSSPGLSQPWGSTCTWHCNAESVGKMGRALANAFSVGIKYSF
jgi:hypothetical protein